MDRSIEDSRVRCLVPVLNNNQRVGVQVQEIELFIDLFYMNDNFAMGISPLSWVSNAEIAPEEG